MPTGLFSTRPWLTVGYWCRPRVIHRTNSEVTHIHRGYASAGRHGLQLRRCCHDSTTAFMHPFLRGGAHLVSRSHTACPRCCVRKRNTTQRALAVAHRNTGARRRRIRTTCPRLAARASWSHTAVSGRLPGLRLLRGNGHRRWTGCGPRCCLDPSQRRRAGHLVDVPSHHPHRCRRRARGERRHHRNRRRRLSDAALGSENWATNVHQPDTHDARPSAAAAVGWHAMTNALSQGVAGRDARIIGSSANTSRSERLRARVCPLVDRAEPGGIHVGVALGS